MDKEYRDHARSNVKRTPRKYKKVGTADVTLLDNPPPVYNYGPKQKLNYNDENCKNGDSNIIQHPVYNQISYVNGQINRMDLGQMKVRCKELELECNGKREAVKRRLKEHFKEQMLLEAGLIKPKENRNVDLFVVIDFEATCEEKNPANYKHEIIEFPAVLVDSKRPAKIVDIFHSFVRPEINTQLSDFCKTLTGNNNRSLLLNVLN